MILYPREPCELNQHLQNLEILREAETPTATHPHCFAAVQSFVTSTKSDMVGWDQRRPAQVRGGCVLTYMLTSLAAAHEAAASIADAPPWIGLPNPNK